MQLKTRLLKWSAGVPVAMIGAKTAELMGIHENDRVSIEKPSSADCRVFLTVVNVVEGMVKEGEIGISLEVKEAFPLKDKQWVEVNIANSPKSLEYIRKKVDKKELSKKEIKEIIKDIVNNSLSEPEIAMFVSGMYENKMTFKETIHLIESFVESGEKLSFKGKYVADKHCIGGIPGNRTTPLVVSICAAAGLVFPKSSSKAITSAAGTADVIESIAKIEFSKQELHKIIERTGAFMIWGGSIELVPADSKIIRIEKMLKIDPHAQLLASILSKKIAVGSKYILIDIPYGKNAKVDLKEGLDLKQSFEKYGKYFKLNLKAVLTKGDEPIGNGVGPFLELLDIIKVLDPSEKGPEDLKERAVFLAGNLLEMTKKAKKNQGEKIAEEILQSGKAFEKFKEIIAAQEGNIKKIKLGEFKKDIFAKKSGEISEINNKKINLLARVAGCPTDKASGVYLYYHVGKKVKKGDKILTIYSESKPRLREAIKYYLKENPIEISKCK